MHLAQVLSKLKNISEQLFCHSARGNLTHMLYKCTISDIVECKRNEWLVPTVGSVVALQ